LLVRAVTSVKPSLQGGWHSVIRPAHSPPPHGAVAPGRGGDLLIAEARMRSRYGRNGVYDVTVTRGDQLIAEFRGRSHEMGDRRP